MNKEIVLMRLKELLSAYTAESPIEQSNDTMTEPMSLSECDAASFFLDVEKEYKVQLDELIPDLIVYSLDAIAGNLIKLCKVNNV
jgi:hypothetical protein